MKKYKIIWYEGYMDLDPKAQQKILNEMEVEAESIDKVDFTVVLPEAETKRYAVEIRYGLRTAWKEGELKDAIATVSDYGSYSRFIYVEEIQ